MYFLTALFCAILSIILFIIFKDKKKLHLDILSIIFSATTIMWFIDCIAGVIEGDNFLSFELPLDIWISIWTILGGLLFWGVYCLIINKKKEN